MKKWTYEIPKEKGWYWFKEQYRETDITYFNGVYFNPGNECKQCEPGDAFFEEYYGDVQWYGPIEPPK